MEIEEWFTRVVKFSEVEEYERNPKKISDHNIRGLHASINKFGYVELIVWNERTGKLVDGHSTFKDLVNRGFDSAEMIVVDMSIDMAKAANLTLNNPSIEGRFTGSALDLLVGLDDGREYFEDGNLNALRESLESGIKPRHSNKNDGDTECPLCGHGWDIDSDDIE